MSAIAIVPLDDSIIFAADGITFDTKTGRSAGVVNKIALLPHLECVIGSVGAGGFLQAVMLAMYSKYLSFDAFVADASELARFTYEKMEEQGATGGSRVILVFGGWSHKTGRFDVYKLHSNSFRKEVAGRLITQKAWKCYPIEASWISTMPDDDVMSRFGLNDPNPQPLDYAARLVCAARAMSGRTKDPLSGKSEAYAVGGFLQMAVLKRESITSWIAHRWPDREGKTVDPTNGAVMPAMPIRVP